MAMKMPFPHNKNWYEESIREENEFAEADEL
jgi:hypothetical protein